jgi:HEAT repeat protein
MKRIVLALAVAVVAVGFAAEDLWAHGGQFRGPGGSVPPGLREPTDPTPPPPPPPSGPPVTPPPTTPTPTQPTPPPVTPTEPTQGPPPPTVTEMPGQPNRPKVTPISFEDWTFWYHNNKDDIENLKAALYALRSSGSEIFRAGDRDDGGHTSATRLTERKVQDVIIPTLLKLMDPKVAGGQDTESAAYIALAKIAKDPEQIKTIMTGLDLALDRQPIVQESAALALGMLRRANPSDQFSARELDKVREFLFKVFEDDKYRDRTRGFAAMGLGLLGDQPQGSGEFASDGMAAARATTNRLWELLKGSYSNQDLYVSLLMAIGLQPQASVTDEMRGALAECALKGRLFKENVNNLIRAYCAHTLGRIGTANDIKPLENILGARRNMEAGIQRSAAIGLGLLGRLVTGDDRVKVAKVLLDAAEGKSSKDNSTINFALISLAYLMIEDIKSGATAVVTATPTAKVLLATAEGGNYLQRGFGALACGLVVREIHDDLEVDVYQDFKQKALVHLRNGISDTALDPRRKAAFCTAAGIAGDSRSKSTMRAIVDDTRADKELRSYAALGIGLIGEPTPEETDAIARALKERSSEELRRQTAVALGLLGNPKIRGTNQDAVDLLLEELQEAKSQSHKGQIVISLARVGDHRAVDKLVELAMNSGEQDLTRALATAGLGLVGDLEWIPSLSRLSKHVNYRASTDVVDEVLSIL